ncbi:right-handed parallel beta-helix repeat-containing protein [Patescibacteria group bacterium]|nr:right-handed parallel beta-helix repeat-containing protein [Patescibacteria group bacterium]
MNTKKLLITKWKRILPLVAIILLLMVVAIPQAIPQQAIQTNILRSVSAAGVVDYSLTGTNDNARFQLALDDLPATGGTLQVVSTGTIDWADGVTVTRAIDNIVIQGAGIGTFFDGDDVTPIFTAGGDYWAFEDFSTDAGGIATGATTDWSMTNILLDTDYYAYRGSLFVGESGVFLDVNALTLEAPTGRNATLVVAASDASDLSKAQADYICDGAADDVEIQAAIDALPAGGGLIHLSEGNYLLSATITLDDYVILEGSGWNTIIKAKNAFGNIDCIATVSKTGVHVRNLQVDGNFANNPRAGSNDDQNGIHFNGCTHSSAEYTYVHDMPDNGLATSSSSTEISFDHNRVEDCHWKGIMVWEGKRCSVSNNHVKGTNIVVEYLSAEENIIIGNVIENAGTASASGVAIWVVAPTFELTICANVIKNSADDGIRLSGGANPLRGVVISNNIIVDAATKGIRFYHDGGGLAIASVTINSNYIYNSGYGIQFLGPGIIEDVVVIGNIIDGSSGFQFDSPGAFTRFTIVGNTVTNGNWAIYGLNGSKHRIAGNTFNTTNFINGDLSTAVIYDQHSDLFMDILAVTANHVVNNEDLSVGLPITFTLAAQPDVPRTLSGHFDSHAQITAYTIAITGVDAKGNTIVETKTEADLWDWETNNAFATVTSIIMSARTGTGAGDTMDIGITDVLGLSNVIYATSDVYKIKKNNANATVAVAQVNATYDTYDMAVIGLAATDNFTIWFRSNLNILN